MDLSIFFIDILEKFYINFENSLGTVLLETYYLKMNSHRITSKLFK